MPMTSFLYVEIYKSHTSLHVVLIEPSSEDTQELGSKLETGAGETVEEWAWGKWLTFLLGGTWGLGLHVSLV